MMKLYSCATAPNPKRVLFFMQETGVSVPIQEVSIRDGEHKQPAYRAISPKGRVPALVLGDDSVILETTAICRYLDQPGPDSPFGGTKVEQARVCMWDRRAELELMFPFAAFFRHTHPAMAALENQFPDYGKSQGEVAKRSLTTFDKQLKDHEWLAGTAGPSVADITAYCTVQFFLPVTRTPFPEDAPNLKRWFDALATRPSFQLT